MFCPKCGAQISDGVTFCAYCGSPVQPTNNAQPGNPQAPVSPYNQYPQSNQYPPYNQYPQNNQYAPSNQLPMNWFKFLIYFSLFAGAVLNVISGLQLFTGAHYGGVADYVYAVFDGLQAVDVLVGLGMIALAAFGIYTRFRLAGYRKNGPKMLTYTYLAGLILSLLYLIAVHIVVPEIAGEVNFTSYIISAVTSVIMVFVNREYFRKRAALFVND